MTTKRPMLAETAPSQVREDEPTASRIAGLIGWCAILIGAVTVGANLYFRDQPRLIPEWAGWILVMLGLFGAVFHAAAENDRLLRFLVGAAGVIGVLGGVALGAIKYTNWPLGLLPLLPGLVFLVLFARREDDPQFRFFTHAGLGGLGALAAIVGLVGMVIYSPWAAGFGAVAALIGLALLAVTISLVEDHQPDLAYLGAVAVGGLGALVLLWGLGRSTLPFVLHDWRSPVPGYALPLAVVGPLLVVFGVAGRLVLPGVLDVKPDTDAARQLRSWSNIAVLTGAILAAVGIARLMATDVLRNAGWGVKTPEPYLVPAGVMQMVLGGLFLLVSVPFWSENKLVVMTRREFTAFFVSPVAYMVMIGFAVIGFASYAVFLLQILARADRGEPLEEPIVQEYIIGIFPVFAVMVAVPLLTMRLFSEEKRTGSLEVLLTAPVEDWQVVLSKFFACLLMFLVLWVPWGLNLVALRLEVGKPFDFRPLLGFAVALTASGASFVAMGLFFSCLTNNQIVSAALSFMGMMVLIAFYFFGFALNVGFLSFLNVGEKTFEAVRTALKTMSFVDMWVDAVRGKIWLKDVTFHVSAAIVWLLMTVKVLESRRWS